MTIKKLTNKLFEICKEFKNVKTTKKRKKRLNKEYQKIILKIKALY